MSLIKSILDYLPMATVLIAVLTFIITFTNFYRNKAKLKVLQIDKGISYIIKPDFIDTKTPDVYHHEDYRVIMDVVITNKSALPVSIIEFTLNDQLIFNSYSKPGEVYKVTTKPANKVINGVNIGFGKSEQVVFDIGDSWIQPVFNIPPYTSIRGHLHFHYHDESNAHEGVNTLTVNTSRGVFSFRVKLSDTLCSPLQLPSNILEARNYDF